MQQTKRLLYCVWGDGTSDELFISLDRAMNDSPKEFLQVLAKISPEETYEVGSIAGVGTEAAALFSGNAGQLRLEFLLAKNSKYSIAIRASHVTASDSLESIKPREISSTVLSRV
jgi:hypothetical protein